MPTRRSAVAESSDSETEFQDVQDDEGTVPDKPKMTPLTIEPPSAPASAPVSAEEQVRQRTIVDRALQQLFEEADSLTSARRLFSRYDRNQTGGLGAEGVRAMLQHLGKGQWEYSKADARRVLAALAPGGDVLTLAAFQREVKLGLLEALRRRWLAQSFSAQEEGQDWTRLWVLFTKHRSGDDCADAADGGQAERLTIQQFGAAARKAGFGAHRGQNMRHTTGSSVCGIAANLSDAELKSLFSLLCEAVQGAPVQRSLTDDGAATPARRGLTFEGFLSFLERGVLHQSQPSDVSASSGYADSYADSAQLEGGALMSPAGRAGRWAHTPRELHPHADAVFEKLLRLKGASVRGALQPPGNFDPTAPMPRLSRKHFARRLAVLGVALREEELSLRKSIILNTEFIILNTESIILNTEFIISNAASSPRQNSIDSHGRS